MAIDVRALYLAALFAIGWGTTAVAVAQDVPSGNPVATVVVREADVQVLPYLQRLGVAVVRRQLAPFSSERDSEARSQAEALEEELVLWLDGDSARVGVLRKRDGMTLSRELEASTFEKDPYVVALAATELLGLMQDTPAIRVEPAEVTTVALPVPPPPRSPPAWVAAVGAEVSTGVREGPGLLRAQLSLDAKLLELGGTFLFAGLMSSPYGEAAERVPDGSGGKVLYRRSDVGLRVGLGRVRRAVDILGYVMADVGFVRVRAEDIDETRERTIQRRSFALSAGGMFRYWLWPRVGFAFSVDVAWLPSPANYLVDGRAVVNEGAARVFSSAALVARLY